MATVTHVQGKDDSLSNLLRKMASAGMGASFAEICTIPIDTAKVRLQVMSIHTVAAPRGD